MIIFVIIIKYNKAALVLAFCSAGGTFGVSKTVAQVAMALPGRQMVASAPLVLPVEAALQSGASGIPGATPQPLIRTRLVRIYRGDGHFDLALAQRLRPTLAKSIDSLSPGANGSRPGPPPPAPIMAVGIPFAIEG